MSETVMLVSNPYFAARGPRLAGTVGVALPGVELRVVRDDGRACAPGEIGAVEVRGPNVFSGYWRMPEKTAEEFTRDGWFRTGDVGHFGGAGVPDDYPTLVAAKDLIISGGYNVYPKEIEGYIDEMPNVVESRSSACRTRTLARRSPRSWSRGAQEPRSRHHRRRAQGPDRELQGAEARVRGRGPATQHDGKSPEERAAGPLSHHVYAANANCGLRLAACGRGSAITASTKLDLPLVYASRLKRKRDANRRFRSP